MGQEKGSGTLVGDLGGKGPSVTPAEAAGGRKRSCSCWGPSVISRGEDAKRQMRSSHPDPHSLPEARHTWPFRKVKHPPG